MAVNPREKVQTHRPAHQRYAGTFANVPRSSPSWTAQWKVCASGSDRTGLHGAFWSMARCPVRRVGRKAARNAANHRHELAPLNCGRLTAPAFDAPSHAGERSSTASIRDIATLKSRPASDVTGNRCLALLPGRCCGGALATMLTANSKRSHASGSNSSGFDGLLVAFVFFIGHLSANQGLTCGSSRTYSRSSD
jgi:hypothetical protein